MPTVKRTNFERIGGYLDDDSTSRLSHIHERVMFVPNRDIQSDSTVSNMRAAVPPEIRLRN
jgi:hypothetical protein